MNLYLIERTDEVGYDEFDSYVIAADDERQAVSLCKWEAIPDQPLIVSMIGTAIFGTLPGVILGSFNAG